MAPPPPRLRLRRTLNSGVLIAVLLYALMYAIYAARASSAVTVFGLTNLLNDTVVLAVASAGLTLIVLTGEFDLSGVAVIGIANVLVATTSGGGLGWLGSLAAVLAVGAAVGALNGILVALLNLQSLAATIGTMIACEGIALLILPAPGGQVADSIAYGLTGDLFGIVPVAAVLLAGLCAAWLAFTRTPLGIAIPAVGADVSAARLSGIDVRRTKLAAFIIAGLCYSLAGYMLSAETGTGDPRASNTLLLFMYAAIAIGGTSLMGGHGGVFGSVVGAGILTVMQKMLFALGVAEFYTDVCNGVIMIVALLVGNLPALLARRMRSGIVP